MAAVVRVLGAMVGGTGLGAMRRQRHALAGVCLQVKVPAQEEAGGAGQPREDAPYADVGVPVSRQVPA